MIASVELIRSCEYLVLHSIAESEEEPLRVVLHEARIGNAADDETLAQRLSPEVHMILANAQSVIHDGDCRVFELVWPRYIGYSVENESYALSETKEVPTEGKGLVKVYSKSFYLDYLAKSTFASPEYPGTFRHWAILCMDHVLNVASMDEPFIRIHRHR